MDNEFFTCDDFVATFGRETALAEDVKDMSAVSLELAPAPQLR